MPARLAVIEGQIVELRTRRPGDRFAPLGLDGHTQTLKKWMIDHKIPQAIRNQIPILIVNGEIAALIVGTQWIISELFAVRDADPSITNFRFL